MLLQNFKRLRVHQVRSVVLLLIQDHRRHYLFLSARRHEKRSFWLELALLEAIGVRSGVRGLHLARIHQDLVVQVQHWRSLSLLQRGKVSD